MRIAILIMGLMLWFIAFLQIMLVGGLSDAADDDKTQTAASMGFLGLVIWLVAIGLVIPWPRLATILFILSGLAMLAGVGEFPDLGAWAVVAGFLAILSYFGSRQKREGSQRTNSG